MLGYVIASLKIRKSWAESSHPGHIHVNRILKEQITMTLCVHSSFRPDLYRTVFSFGTTSGIDCVDRIVKPRIVLHVLQYLRRSLVT